MAAGLTGCLAGGAAPKLSEIAIAALLLIGYRTRLVGLIGATMAVPIGLSVIYYPKGDEWAWSYILMIGLHLLLAAVGAGDHLGVDGALKGSRERASRALQIMGIASAVVGVMGLFVARSVGFASSKLALLGSDAGFVADGKLTRRWELKLLFFNPLWALLTIVFAALLVAGSRKASVAWAGAAGFGVIALVGLLMKTFDYARDDGQVQKISSGSNVAFWGGLALAGALLARRVGVVTIAADSTANESAVE